MDFGLQIATSWLPFSEETRPSSTAKPREQFLVSTGLGTPRAASGWGQRADWVVEAQINFHVGSWLFGAALKCFDKKCFPRSLVPLLPLNSRFQHAQLLGLDLVHLGQGSFLLWFCSPSGQQFLLLPPALLSSHSPCSADGRGARGEAAQGAAAPFPRD